MKTRRKLDPKIVANIARGVRKSRTTQGVTMGALAARADLDIATVFRVENGDHVNPSLNTVLALAAATKQPLSKLLGVKV
jgi:transcriptional regulator with XRE-family HTH domain